MKLNINTLYIVSTPIGNLDDITIRAIEVLKNSDHKFNEKKQVNSVIEHLNSGKILTLISDAGTPLLSDPGKLLINCCIEKNLKVISIPGASSITSAMSLTGFKDQFLFYGFLPKKENELNKVLSDLSKYKFSLIFFVPSL